MATFANRGDKVIFCYLKLLSKASVEELDYVISSNLRSTYHGPDIWGTSSGQRHQCLKEYRPSLFYPLSTKQGDHRGIFESKGDIYSLTLALTVTLVPMIIMVIAIFPAWYPYRKTWCLYRRQWILTDWSSQYTRRHSQNMFNPLWIWKRF